MPETFKGGWHLGNVRPMTDQDRQILERVPPHAVVYLAGEAIGAEEVAWILRVNPACHVIVRPYYTPQPYTLAGVDRYVEQCRRALREVAGLVPAGQLHLKPFCEPNQPTWAQWEGFGPFEDAQRQYADAFCRVVDALRPEFPTVRMMGFSLTDGNRDVWFPGDDVGGYYYHGPEAARLNPSEAQVAAAIRLGNCYRVLQACDEISVHVYVHERGVERARGEDPRDNWRQPWYGLRYRQIAKYTAGNPLWITECGFPRADLWPAWGDDALMDWVGQVQADPLVQGFCLWMLGNSPGWGSMWYPGGQIRGLVERLAAYRATLGQAVVPAAPPAGGDGVEGLNARISMALQAHVLPANPDAALARAAAARGLVVASDELRYAEDGVTWVCQAFRRPADAVTVQHHVRTRDGDWDPARFVWWTWVN